MMQRISINDLTYNVLNGVVAQHDRFWNKVNQGKWEQDTFDIIDKNVDADTLAIDCGAWIGPTLFYTAQRAGLSLGFEPDPVAYETLTANARLNHDAPWSDRFKIFNDAIHSSGKPIQISAAGGGGNSMTSILNVNSDTVWSVGTQRLDNVIEKYRGDFRKIFIKIDIEGGEYDILPDLKSVMADENTSLLISFHHRRLKISLSEKHEAPSAASEALSSTLNQVVDALPWNRVICTTEGENLDYKATKQAADSGRSFGNDILIR